MSLKGIYCITMELIFIRYPIIVFTTTHKEKPTRVVHCFRRLLECTVAPCSRSVRLGARLGTECWILFCETLSVGLRKALALVVLLRDPVFGVMNEIVVGEHDEVVAHIAVQERGLDRERPPVGNERMHMKIPLVPLARRLCGGDPRRRGKCHREFEEQLSC